MVDSGGRRGRSYDAEATRTAILNAAEAVFAEHGFDGARVDTIAAEAGYNKSLIFQYFGDKLRLYAEVLKRADAEAHELRTQIFVPLLQNPGLASNAHALRAFFEQAFHAVFDYLLAHPRMMRILLWEMAEGWQTYTQITSGIQMEGTSQIDTLFQEAQRAGLIRSTFSPAIQLTMALQICQSYIASLPLFQTLLPTEDLASATATARAREYVVGIVVAGILVDS
jgi:AcrR family transcriptional regulator